MSKTHVDTYRYNCDHCGLELVGTWVRLVNEGGFNSPTLHVISTDFEWVEKVYDTLDFCTASCAGAWLTALIMMLKASTPRPVSPPDDVEEDDADAECENQF